MATDVAAGQYPDPGGPAGWAVDAMEVLGAAGAGLMVAAENLFPPLPSELILPLSGFAAARGDFSLVAALVWTTAGSLAGALVLYLAGRRLGSRRTRTLLSRLPLVGGDDVMRAEQWFARHGDKAVFFGRMVPLVRSFVSLPAGTARMPPVRFVLFTTAGSALWNGAFVLAGYELGREWDRVDRYATVGQALVLAALAFVVLRFALRRLRGG